MDVVEGNVVERMLLHGLYGIAAVMTRKFTWSLYQMLNRQTDALAMGKYYRLLVWYCLGMWNLFTTIARQKEESKMRRVTMKCEEKSEYVKVEKNTKESTLMKY